MEEGRFDVLAGGHIRGHRTAGGHWRSGISREGGAGVSRHRPSRLRDTEANVTNHTGIVTTILFSSLKSHNNIQLGGVWTFNCQSPITALMKW